MTKRLVMLLATRKGDEKVGKLLLDKPPLMVNVDLASIIGLNESIVIQQVHYWLEKNREKKLNFHDGRYWTYNSIKKWKENFPFWSEKTIERTFSIVVNMGIFVTGNYNRDKRDRTKWYTIDYEKLDFYIRSYQLTMNHNGECIQTNCRNEYGQTAEMHTDDMGEALPENISETSSKKMSVCQSLISKKNTLTEDEAEIERILEHTNLDLYPENMRKLIRQTIEDIFFLSEFHKEINMPASLVRRRLHSLNRHCIDRALRNIQLKDESSGEPIKRLNLYFRKVIWNSITEGQFIEDNA